MTESDDAFREFVLSALVQYECRLVRYASRLLRGNEDMARDVVQHVFMKLCEQDMDAVKDRIGPWLFRVCRNRTIDLVRGESGTQQAFETLLNRADGRQQNPIDVAETLDLLEHLQNLIATLPSAQQEVVELWSHGLKHDEIAEVMDKNPGAVRGILHRAIKTLKNNDRVRGWLRETDESNAVAFEPKHATSVEQN